MCMCRYKIHLYAGADPGNFIGGTIKIFELKVLNLGVGVGGLRTAQ